MDGGIRVPCVVRFPSQIPKGIEIGVPTTQMDMFTTISNLIQADIPQDRIIDGKDIMPVLKQKQNVSPNEFLYHYCLNEVQAMRYMPSTGNIYYRIK